jgi:hypothetical protein
VVARRPKLALIVWRTLRREVARDARTLTNGLSPDRVRFNRRPLIDVRLILPGVLDRSRGDLQREVVRCVSRSFRKVVLSPPASRAHRQRCREITVVVTAGVPELVLLGPNRHLPHFRVVDDFRIRSYHAR